MSRTSKKSPPVKSVEQSFEPIEAFRHRGGGHSSDEELLDLLAFTINSLRKTASNSILEIGFRLIEAKAFTGHGKWLPWLETNFGWTERTAQRYMSVYELVSKYDTVSDLELPMKALYQLAAPSTPEAAIEEVIARAETGEELSSADVETIIEDAKPPKKPKGTGGPVVSTKGEKFSRAAFNAEMAKGAAHAEQCLTAHAPTGSETKPDMEASATSPKDIVGTFTLSQIVKALVEEYGAEEVMCQVLVHDPSLDTMVPTDLCAKYWSITHLHSVSKKPSRSLLSSTKKDQFRKLS